jgi:hypothetical protein
MYWEETFHALQFDDDTVVHDNVDSITDIERDVSITNWHRNLLPSGDAARRKLVHQTSFVCALQ